MRKKYLILSNDIDFLDIKSFKENVIKHLNERVFEDFFFHCYNYNFDEQQFVFIKYLVRYAQKNNISFKDGNKYFKVLIKDANFSSDKRKLLKLFISKGIIKQSQLNSLIYFCIEHIKVEFLNLFLEHKDDISDMQDYLLDFYYGRSDDFFVSESSVNAGFEIVIKKSTFCNKNYKSHIEKILNYQDSSFLKLYLITYPELDYTIDDFILFKITESLFIDEIPAYFFKTKGFTKKFKQNNKLYNKHKDNACFEKFFLENNIAEF